MQTLQRTAPPSLTIVIHDEEELAREKARIRKAAVKAAREIGKWECPGCGKVISANKDLCADCAAAKETESAG